VIREDIYEYAFKRTAADLDELISLAVTIEQLGRLKDARRALWDARPTVDSGPPVTPMVPSRPTKANAPWTRAEDQLLQDTWTGGEKSVMRLAGIFGRSAGAITSRLDKLGLVDRENSERSESGSTPNPTLPLPFPCPKTESTGADYCQCPIEDFRDYPEDGWCRVCRKHTRAAIEEAKANLAGPVNKYNTGILRNKITGTAWN
jgi:hypothetical protein